MLTADEIIQNEITRAIEIAMHTVCLYQGCAEIEEVISQTEAQILNIAKAHTSALARSYKDILK